jgi:type III pantothenate kinase
MTPDVVADVGNSRIKWGLCVGGSVRATCALPPEEPAVWEQQRQRWDLTEDCQWVVTGVHPPRRGQFVAWLRQCGQRLQVLDKPEDLPLRVSVARPEQVGVDRLLDAVAANSRRPAGVPAVIIDAGSAVTVDLVDAGGAFAGGAIVPGLRLMAQALHDYTALLPLIEPPLPEGRASPPLPGTTTTTAIEAGIFWAVAGGVEAILREYRRHGGCSVEVFLTGGDGAALQAILPFAHLWPAMTLEGIRLSAEALP